MAACDSPLPPSPPYFDDEQGAWVLSRYADVLAALREPELHQVFSQKAASQANAGRGVLNALQPAQLAEWRARIEHRAHSMMARLPSERPLDLVRGFIHPWCRDAALVAINASFLLPLAQILPPRATRKLALLRGRMSRRIAAADAKALYLGISETLSRYMANSWLTLFRDSSGFARLRSEPHLIPAAIDELLRHAGAVHTLVRQAGSEIRLGPLTIKRGEKVILKVASANRDPAQFLNPDRLDVVRHSKGHLTLGAGPHACPGGAMIRAASGIATANLVKEFAAVEIAAPVEWNKGATLCWPKSVPVLLSRPAIPRTSR
jgi:cytochrome P450